MRDEIDPKLRKLAAAMRKSPTEAERRLWWALRHSLALKGTHFRRQVVIERAIVDFACMQRERSSKSTATSTDAIAPSPTTPNARKPLKPRAGAYCDFQMAKFCASWKMCWKRSSPRSRDGFDGRQVARAPPLTPPCQDGEGNARAA